MDIKNKDIFEKILETKRVVKKITGGNKLTFTSLALVGDKKGKVGISLGKGNNMQQATMKAFSQAKKKMVQIKIVNDTIPHEVEAKFKSSKILMKPAKAGTGVVAGGSIRDLVELAGISNISVKLLGSSNKVTNIYAALKALEKLK